MPAKKAITLKKKSEKKSEKVSILKRIKVSVGRIKKRVQDFLARRPHRSFRRTRRRDYVRKLRLPGYIVFTHFVFKTLWERKWLFFGLALVYGMLTALFVGLASQQTYEQISASLNTSEGFMEGGWGQIGKAGLLLAAGVTGGLNAAQSANGMGIQQVVVTLLALLITWLATVWLLRAQLAGQKPRLRDALYNSGSPVISTFFVSLALVIQALPIAVAIIGLVAASASGLFEGGVEAMVFWIFALLLTVLSLYWMTSTFIALIVVTLPGMYPMKALRTAGDLVIGRRIRILLRFLWLAFIVVVVWVAIMIPIILLDQWLKQLIPAISWLPIVPLSLLLMVSLTIVWTAGYVYLLYRKVVDDDSAPA